MREHAKATGENLFQQACDKVTDGQIQALETKTQWQRVDSTQLLSSPAQMSRLELVITLMQKLWQKVGEENRAP